MKQCIEVLSLFSFLFFSNQTVHWNEINQIRGACAIIKLLVSNTAFIFWFIGCWRCTKRRNGDFFFWFGWREWPSDCWTWCSWALGSGKMAGGMTWAINQMNYPCLGFLSDYVRSYVLLILLTCPKYTPYPHCLYLWFSCLFWNGFYGTIWSVTVCSEYWGKFGDCVISLDLYCRNVYFLLVWEWTLRIDCFLFEQEHPGCQIYGQTMTTDHHDELVKIGINPSLKGVKTTHQFPYVIFCAPPSRTSDYPADVR